MVRSAYEGSPHNRAAVWKGSRIWIVDNLRTAKVMRPLIGHSWDDYKVLHSLPDVSPLFELLIVTLSRRMK
jgi:hypothetical protein